MLDVFQVLRAWPARAALCRFTAGRTHIGDLLVTRVTDERVLVVYKCLLADPAWTPTPDHFRLIRKPNGVDRGRAYFACKGCKNAKATLFLRGTWMCASCHRLGYRQQKLDKLTVAWERRRSLEAQIAVGRPRYMRHRKYRALLSELEKLRKMPPRSQAYPNTAHRQMVESRWLALNEAGDSIVGDYVFAGDRYVERPPPPDPVPARPPQAQVVRANPWYDDDEDSIEEL